MPYTPKQFRFKIEAYIIDYNTGEYKDFGGQISAIAIKKQYADKVYPLYNVTMHVSINDAKYLATNAYFLSLKIYRCPIDDNILSGKDSDFSSLISDKLVTDIILRPFDSPKTYEQLQTSDSDSENNINQSQYVNISVNFVPKEQLRNNNSVINDCYAGANIAEVMINLLSNNYSKKVYIQHIDKTDRYDSLLIPPQSLVRAIKFLHQNYGIYKYSVNMFFDYDKLYIYDLLDETREHVSNLYIEIENSLDNSDMTKYGKIFYNDNELSIRKYLSGDPILQSSKDIFNFALGDIVNYSSYDDNFNIVNRQTVLQSENKNGDEKIRYYWNSDKEKYFEERTTKKISEMTTISLDAFDFTTINPTTSIMISGSNNKNINGQYCLLSEEIFFGTRDYKSFNNSVNLTLGKY